MTALFRWISSLLGIDGPMATSYLGPAALVLLIVGIGIKELRWEMKRRKFSGRDVRAGR